MSREIARASSAPPSTSTSARRTWWANGRRVNCWATAGVASTARRSRERIWKSELDNDKLAAYLTLYECLTTLVTLLSPFMPFMTEELWAKTGETGPARSTLLIEAPWPDLPPFRDAAAEREIGWVIGLISEIRSVLGVLS